MHNKILHNGMISLTFPFFLHLSLSLSLSPNIRQNDYEETYILILCNYVCFTNRCCACQNRSKCKISVCKSWGCNLAKISTVNSDPRQVNDNDSNRDSLCMLLLVSEYNSRVLKSRVTIWVIIYVFLKLRIQWEINRRIKPFSYKAWNYEKLKFSLSIWIKT